MTIHIVNAQQQPQRTKKKNRTLEPVLHATPYLSSMQIDIQLIDKANQLLTGLEKQKLMKSRKKNK